MKDSFHFKLLKPLVENYQRSLEFQLRFRSFFSGMIIISLIALIWIPFDEKLCSHAWPFVVGFLFVILLSTLWLMMARNLRIQGFIAIVKQVDERMDLLEALKNYYDYPGPLSEQKLQEINEEIFSLKREKQLFIDLYHKTTYRWF